jgi:hypothetical protein
MDAHDGMAGLFNGREPPVIPNGFVTIQAKENKEAVFTVNIRGFQWFPHNGQYPLSFLAGAFCNELFQPVAEARDAG